MKKRKIKSKIIIYEEKKNKIKNYHYNNVIISINRMYYNFSK